MKKILVVLAVVALAVPAFAAVGDKDFFKVTGDGAFDLDRGSWELGNSGASGMPRFSKSNQDTGWMSFYNAVGDAGGSIADFVSNKAGGDWSKVQAKLYFRTDGLGDAGSKIGIISIRSGNVGAIQEDPNTGGASWVGGNPPAGYQGTTQVTAFRTCQSPYSANKGAGLYPLDDPTYGDPALNGQPWITPAGRAANSGSTPWQFGPGAEIRYGSGNDPAAETFDGYFEDTSAGRNFWALEDLLGLRGNNGMAGGGAAQVYTAGQIMIGGQAAPTMFNPKDAAFNATDVRNGTTDPDWKAITLDQAFIQDIATNLQNKGIFFTSRIGGLGVDDWSNFAFYSKDQAGGAWAPYIALEVVPEPATLCLLALGGLALLRRRQA